MSAAGIYDIRVRANLADGRTGYVDSSIKVLPPSADELYVAMGDSYSSGEGVEPWESGTDSQVAVPFWPLPAYGTLKLNLCHRSEKAYSALLADRLNLPRRKFIACSGATTQDLSNRWQYATQGPQISQLAPAGPNMNVTAITLSVGGNDVLFPEVLPACIETLTGSGDCWGKLASARAKMVELGGPSGTLAESLKLVHQAAPLAQIHLVGYPRLFPTSPPDVCNLKGWGGILAKIRKSQMEAINAGHDELISTMRSVASSLPYVTFSDPTEAFSGHEVCTADSYLRGVVFKIPNWAVNPIHPEMPALNDLPNQVSFHPNENGQVAYADVLEESMSRTPALDLSPNESAVRTASMPTGVSSATWKVRWDGSTVGVSLISPAGLRSSSSTDDPGIHWEITPTGVTVTVQNPEDGEWRVELDGVDVDSSGEPVWVDLERVQQANTPPVVNLEATAATGAAYGTFDFLASALDSDGTISSYEWDFDGDGAADATTTENTIQRVLPDGRHPVAVAVVDNEGARGYASLEQPIILGDLGELPVANSDSFVVVAGSTTQLDVTGNDSDTSGPLDDNLVELRVEPSNGGTAIATTDGHISYTAPDAGETSDSLLYALCKPQVGCSTADVEIEITPRIATPLAVDDTYVVGSGETLNVPSPGVLSNDSGAAVTDVLSAEVVTTTTSGVLSLEADGSFTYRPSPGFLGLDTFSYQIQNQSGTRSEPATVSITVNPPSGNSGALEGTVKAGGTLSRGSQVRIFRVGAASPSRIVFTDSSGKWSAVGLAPGDYELQVVPSTRRHLRAWVGLTSLRADARVFSLTSGSLVAGLLSDLQIRS
jgi:hypothetical protein